MNAGLLDSHFRGNDGQSARIAHGNFGKALTVLPFKLTGPTWLCYDSAHLSTRF